MKTRSLPSPSSLPLLQPHTVPIHVDYAYTISRSQTTGIIELPTLSLSPIPPSFSNPDSFNNLPDTLISGLRRESIASSSSFYVSNGLRCLLVLRKCACVFVRSFECRDVDVSVAVRASRGGEYVVAAAAWGRGYWRSLCLERKEK